MFIALANFGPVFFAPPPSPPPLKPPPGGFGYSYGNQIYTRRGPGQALGALLGWMESAVRQWGESGLAAWLRFGFCVATSLLTCFPKLAL